jgi:hypothetical protein
MGYRIGGQAFPEAAVAGWEALEAGMPNKPKDRHVVAASKEVDASLIDAANLRDFITLPPGIEAVTPDAALLNRFQSMPLEASLGSAGRRLTPESRPRSRRAAAA